MSVYARNLLRQLVAMGHDVVMISQYRADPTGKGVYGGGPPPAVPGVQTIGLESVGEGRTHHGQPADFEGDMQAMVDAGMAAHARRPFDLVHAQYAYPTGTAALEISRRTGIPNIVSIQGGDGHWVGGCCETHRLAMQAVLDHANDLLIGSQSFAAEVHDNHGTPIKRFTVVPGAVDTERFYPPPDKTPGDLGARPRFVYHGRVDHRKGALELIDAVDRLRDGPDFEVLISGIGPDYEATQRYVAELALQDRVVFSGYVDYDQVPEVYRAADVFVSPTWSEGFSNTIVEAMATGLPVISTRSVGVVDCIDHDRNGLLTAVHDVEAFAAAMRRVLVDEPLRRRLAAAALADVMAEYRWPVVAGQIADRYQAIRHRAPDNDWTAFYAPGRGMAEADLDCRFRRDPHLL